MERIRTLFAVIVSTVLTLGFVGCAYLTLQGKGPAYYQGIVTPATTMLFLALLLGLVILAVLPDAKAAEATEEPTLEDLSIPIQPSPAQSSSTQYRAVVEVPIEEE